MLLDNLRSCLQGSRERSRLSDVVHDERTLPPDRTSPSKRRICQSWSPKSTVPPRAVTPRAAALTDETMPRAADLLARVLGAPPSHVIARERPDSLHLALSRAPPAPGPQPPDAQLTVLSPSTPASTSEHLRNRVQPPTLVGWLFLAVLLWYALDIARAFARQAPADLAALGARWPAVPFFARLLLCAVHECFTLMYLGLALYFAWGALQFEPASQGVLCHNLTVSNQQLCAAGECAPLALVKHFRIVSRVKKIALLGVPLRRPKASFGVEAVTYGHPLVLAPISSQHVAEKSARILNEFMAKCRGTNGDAATSQPAPPRTLSAALRDAPVERGSFFGPATATVTEEGEGELRQLSVIFTSPVRVSMRLRWLAASSVAKYASDIVMIGKMSLATLMSTYQVWILGMLLFVTMLDVFLPAFREYWDFSENVITMQVRCGRIVLSKRHVPTAGVSHLSFVKDKETEQEGYATESGTRYMLDLTKKDDTLLGGAIPVLETEAIHICRALSRMYSKATIRVKFEGTELRRSASASW